MKLLRLPQSVAGSNVAELGANHVALGQFSVRGEAIVLDRFGFEREPAEASGDATGGAAMAQALSRVASSVGMLGKLAVVVPSDVSLTKFIEVPALKRAQLRKVIQFEAAQQIPYPLGEVVWDHGVLAESNGRLEIVLSAAKLEPMRELCGALDERGFQIERATPAGIAVAYCFRQNYPEVEGGALVVEVGAHSTLLLFIDSKRFFLRTLRLGRGGANDATFELGEDFNRRLLQEVSRSIVAMRRQSNAIEPVRVYVADGSPARETVAALLEEQCKCPVAPFDTLRRVDVSTQAEAAGARTYAPQLASLVGLGVIAVKAVPNVPSIVPEHWSRKIASRRQILWLIAGTSLVAAAMLPPLLYFRNVETRQSEEVHKLDTRLHLLRRLAAKNSDHLIAIEQLEREVARSQSLAQTRTSWVRFFADLQTRLTEVEDVWFEKLMVVDDGDEVQRGEVGKPRVRGPLRLAISGRMLQRNADQGTRATSHSKVKRLLASLRGSAFVNAIEGERFDDSEADVLRFNFTIVAKADSQL